MPKGVPKKRAKLLDIVPAHAPQQKHSKDGAAISSGERQVLISCTASQVQDSDHHDCLQRAQTIFEVNRKHGRICKLHVRVGQPCDESGLHLAPLQIMREIDFRLPGYLTREYWTRHGCTVEDIRWILMCSSPIYSWHIAMLENISISNAAIKDCSAAADTIGYGGKAIAIEKLRKLYCESYCQDHDQNNFSVLFFPSAKGNVSSIDLEKTYFPLPFHTVSRAQFDEFTRQYNEAWKQGVEMRRTWFQQPILTFKSIWKFKDIYCVPTRLVKSFPPCVFLSRIVPFTWYSQWFDMNPCLSDCKDIVYVNDEIFVCMDENFYCYTTDAAVDTWFEKSHGKDKDAT